MKIEENGKQYTLVERQVKGQDGKKYPSVKFIEQGEELKEGDKELEAMPAESFHAKLQAMRPVKLREDRENRPAWQWVVFTLSDADRAAIVSARKAKDKKANRKIAEGAVKQYKKDLMDGKDLDFVRELAKRFPAEVAIAAAHANK